MKKQKILGIIFLFLSVCLLYYLACKKRGGVDPLDDVNKLTIFISEINLDKDEIASGGDIANLSVKVINKLNEPVEGKTVNFSALKGTVTTADTTDDEGNAAGLYYSSDEAGTDTIFIYTYGYGNKQVKEYITIEIKIEKYVHSISLTSDKNEILANGIETIEITAKILDNEDQPVSDYKINFYKGAGELEEFKYSDSNGEVVLTYMGISSTGDSIVRLISYTGNSLSYIGLSDTLDVLLKGVNVEINAYPKTLKAGSDSASNIIVYVKEASTNIPIPNAELTFSSTLGSIDLSATTNNSGLAETKLYSPEVPGEACVVVRYGNLLTDSVKVIFSGVNMNVQANPLNIIADGETSSKITITITNASGIPIENVDVELSTNLGELLYGSGKTDESGEFSDYITSTTSGTAKITINAGDQTKTLNVRFTGYIFKLWATPEIITAGIQSTVITAELKDNYGEAVDGALISFSASIGAISNADSNTNAIGRAAAVFTSDGAGQAVITAITKINEEEVQQSITVSVTSAPPENIVLIADPSVIEINDGESIISAIVTDLNGNPVENAAVSFTKIKGPGGGETFAENIANTNENGVALNKFISGSIGSSQPNDVQIQARVQGTNIESEIVTLTIAGVPKSIVVGYSSQVRTDNSGNYIIDISAIVTDINGNPVIDGTVVAFTQGNIIGSLESNIPTVDGIATATFIYSQDKASQSITIIAESKGIKGETKFKLPGSSGVISSLEFLQPVTREILANGQSYITIKALALDANESPVENIKIDFSTSHGIIENASFTGSELTEDGFPNDDWGKAAVRLTSAADSVDIYPTIIAYYGNYSDTLYSSETEGVIFRGVDLKMDVSSDSVWSGEDVKVSVILKRTVDQVAIPDQLIYFGTNKGVILESNFTDNLGRANGTLYTDNEYGYATVSVIYGNAIVKSRVLKILDSEYYNRTPVKIELISDYTEIFAEGINKINFTGTVLNIFNNPISDVTVQIAKSGDGELNKISDVTDSEGKFYFTLTSPASKTNKFSSVNAYINSVSSNVININFKGIEVILESNRQTLPANGRKKAYLKAEVLEYTSRNPIQAGLVNFSSTLGSISYSDELDENGYANSVFTAGTSTGITKIRASFGNIADSINIELYESVPGNIRVSADDSVLSIERTDIGSEIAVLITDAYQDTIVNNTQVLLTSKLCKFSNGFNYISLYTHDGTAETVIYPDADKGTGTDTVIINSGSLEVYRELITVNSSTVDTILAGYGNPLVANGISTLEVTVLVRDEYGHSIADGVQIRFYIESGPGTIEPGFDNVISNNGQAICKLKYAESDAGKNLTLKIVTGGKTFYKTFILP